MMGGLSMIGIWCTVVLGFLGFMHCNGQSFSLQMHHKFSEQVRTWMTRRYGMDGDRDDWPVEGSKEYYRTLYHHDNVRHGRSLIDNNTLTFYGGNETIKFARLGFLYYTFIQLGTPNTTLMVALDTGSDLLWVPCDCQQCAPTSGDLYGLKFQLETYSPSASNTSKPVTCDSDLCDLPQTCSASTDQCPYNRPYFSESSSSSGKLVEDVLYLTSGDGIDNGKVVQAPITFGCGQVQTGSFLKGAAPNGLLGLGIEPIAVPTILAKKGFVRNSFSMCFPNNGSTGSTGRFAFGDKGSSDQKQTSFIIDQRDPKYYVGVKGFYVGKKLISTAFQVLFDTGTSVTYLADPAYKELTTNFHQQTQDARLTVGGIPFEFCYQVGDNQSISRAREISLNFDGGSSFPIIQPLAFIHMAIRKLDSYCLAVIHTSDISVIGQNFMTGYQLVFDREQLKLGWKEANCYDVKYSSSPSSPGATLPSPVNAPSLDTDNSSRSSKKLFLHIAFSFLASAIILTLI